MKLADTVIEKDWDRDKGFVCGCLHQLNKPFFSCRDRKNIVSEHG